MCASDDEDDEEQPEHHFAGYSVRYRKRMTIREHSRRRKSQIIEQDQLPQNKPMGNTLDVCAPEHSMGNRLEVSSAEHGVVPRLEVTSADHM